MDIGVTFHIGKPDTREEDCRRFIYFLGANRLQELLEQEVEEAIRNLVRGIKVKNDRPKKLESGDAIRFGGVEFYFFYSDELYRAIPEFGLQAMDADAAYQVFATIVIDLFGFTHYYLDSFIWKVRDRNVQGGL